MFMKVIRSLALFAFIFAMSAGVAHADPACTAWSQGSGGIFGIPAFCVGWELVPGASTCPSSTPAANEVLVYSAINYGGQCSRVPVGDVVGDFGSNGWKNSIRSMKVGTSAHLYACNSTNFGWGCSTMGSPYGQNFPNTNGSQNWGSIQAY